MNLSDLRKEVHSELRLQFSEGESFAILREMIFYLTGDLIPFPEGKKITDEEYSTAKKWLLRIQQGEPIQYVTGKMLFRDFDLNVNSSVLIPRPETAELPDLIVSEIESAPDSFIDLGTGSGCIAIALAKIYTDAEGNACDISLDALQTAKGNAHDNKVEINFFWQDMNDPEFLTGNKMYDLIVSNPPYISAAEFNSLEKNVIDFEPHSALFAPADDALHFYRRIAAFARTHLNNNGSLWLELNPLFADETADIFRHAGMKDVRIYPDLTGKDRFIGVFI